MEELIMLKEKLTGLFYNVTVDHNASVPIVMLGGKLKDAAEDDHKTKSAKSQLKKSLDYADSIKDMSDIRTDDYIEAKWDNFLYIREIVREVLENRDSSVDDIESAMWQIQYVIGQLGINF